MRRLITPRLKLKRKKSILALIDEHERETCLDERKNIRRTLIETMEDAPIELPRKKP